MAVAFEGQQATVRDTLTLLENTPARDQRTGPHSWASLVVSGDHDARKGMREGVYTDQAKAAYAAGDHYLLGVRRSRNPLPCEKWWSGACAPGPGGILRFRKTKRPRDGVRCLSGLRQQAANRLRVRLWDALVLEGAGHRVREVVAAGCWRSAAELAPLVVDAAAV